jgi:hypothetical protein
MLLGPQPLHLGLLLLLNYPKYWTFHLAEANATLGTLRLMGGETNSIWTGPYIQAAALAYLRGRKCDSKPETSGAVEVGSESRLFAFCWGRVEWRASTTAIRLGQPTRR